MRTFIIATTPRTGSNLLCESLRATGIAGNPTELFCFSSRQNNRQRWQLPADTPFNKYFKTAIDQLMTPNGVFGVKVHWSQLVWLAAENPPHKPTSVLKALFPDAVYINLYRSDVRSQAISFYRASESNKWWRIDGVLYPAITAPDPDFDRSKILELERLLLSQQACWREYFADNGIEPLRIEYEKLDRCRCIEVGRCLDFLGLDPSAANTLPDTRLVRQADIKAALWKKLLDDSTLARQ
jgi:trehalose 2-sulfotransferase